MYEHKITLKRQYREYLQSKCGIKESSTYTYTGALNFVSRVLKSKGYVRNDIYEVRQLRNLKWLIDTAKQLTEVKERDIIDHRINCLSLDHYYDYAANSNCFSHRWI